MNPAGLPHSEISGSKAVCAYPKLIAAYHVLHRFPEPRHPPCALNCLTSTSRFPQKKTRKTKIPHAQKPATATPNTYGLATASLHTSLPQHSLVKDRSPTKHTTPAGARSPKAPLLYPDTHQNTRQSPPYPAIPLFASYIALAVPMENTGIEPVTSCLQSRRSPN